MYLLDTCSLLWLVADQTKFSLKARECIAQHPAALFISAISAFEIGLRHANGRIRLPLAPQLWWKESLAFHGIREIAVSGDIAAESTALPSIHNDPCDRIIVATAKLNGMTVLTPDPLIRKYPDIRTEW